MAKSRKKTRQIGNTLYKYYENPVTRTSMEAFLTVGLIIFFALFAIRPTLITISELINEIDQKKEFNEQLEQKTLMLTSAKRLYDQHSDQIPMIDQALPQKDPDLLKVLTLFEKMASENEIAIVSMQIPSSKSQKTIKNDQQKEEELAVGLNNYFFKIELVGDYESIYNYINDLVNSRRMFLVDSIEFVTKEENSREQVEGLKAYLQVNCVYLD